MKLQQKPITIYLAEPEAIALDELAEKKGLTKAAVVRQALRLYQLVEAKNERGERFFFEDEGKKEKSQLLML